MVRNGTVATKLLDMQMQYKEPDMTATSTTEFFATTEFKLRFRSLFNPGRGFAFPCDSHGKVDMDGLSERARNNYLFARAMVGRDLAAPAVEPAWDAAVPA